LDGIPTVGQVEAETLFRSFVGDFHLFVVEKREKPRMRLSIAKGQ